MAGSGGVSYRFSITAPQHDFSILNVVAAAPQTEESVCGHLRLDSLL